MRVLRILLAVVLLAVAASLMVAPTKALGTGCWVKNVRTQVVGTDLAAAINAAQKGDVIKVRGTCEPSAMSDITLVGPARIGYPEGPPGHPSGGIDTAGRVTLKNLVIDAAGSDSSDAGGGIRNSGTLILKGYTKVTGNFGEDGAGGIRNEGLLVMKDYAEVTGNEVLYGPGGGIWNDGMLVMEDHAKITENGSGGFGGGVFNGGTLVMKDHAKVARNQSTYGGGVYNSGTLVMRNS